MQRMESGKESAEAAMRDARSRGGELTVSGIMESRYQPSQNLLVLSITGSDMVKTPFEILEHAAKGSAALKDFMVRMSPIGLAASMTSAYGVIYSQLLREALTSLSVDPNKIVMKVSAADILKELYGASMVASSSKDVKQDDPKKTPVKEEPKKEVKGEGEKGGSKPSEAAGVGSTTAGAGGSGTGLGATTLSPAEELKEVMNMLMYDKEVEKDLTQEQFKMMDEFLSENSISFNIMRSFFPSEATTANPLIYMFAENMDNLLTKYVSVEDFKAAVVNIPESITNDALVQSAKTSVLEMIVQVMHRGFGIVVNRSFTSLESCSELRPIVAVGLEILLKENVTSTELERAMAATTKTEKENRICDGLIKMKESIEIQIKVPTVLRMSQLIVKEGTMFEKKSLMISEEPTKVILTGVINELAEDNQSFLKEMISDFGFFTASVAILLMIGKNSGMKLGLATDGM